LARFGKARICWINHREDEKQVITGSLLIIPAQ
jgi:hypothetical protein